MASASLWLMIVGMGVYQGLNPTMGWLHAVGRGLERRSEGAVLGAAWSLAAGHYAAMVAVLFPAAIALALLGARPTVILPVVGPAMVGFGVWKLWRARHPRFASRIPPRRAMRWSFLMALTHCGSPLMMLSPLASVLALLAASGRPDPASYAAGALAVPAAMTLPLFATASLIALAVYRRFGLGALTRIWFDLDRLWCVAFVLMGLMAVLMDRPDLAAQLPLLGHLCAAAGGG
jgi:hypothetical protein